LTYLIFNNLLNYSLNNSASQSVGLSARLLVGLSVGWLIDQSGAKVPDDFKDEVMFLQLLRCLKIIYTIGCTAAYAGSFAQTVDYKASRAAVQSAKSRYDLVTWNSVARPLRNLLRERQRAALVTYLLANSTLWRDANDLFAYFLIDIEMGPCQLTSRIKQAICSAQLFGQRCLLNLEQAVRADSAIDTVWNEWS